MSKPGPFIPCPTLCLPRLLSLLPSTSKDVREIELGSLWAGQGGGEREYPVAQIPFLASQLLIGQKTSRRGLSWGWCFLEKWKCPLEQQLEPHGSTD